MPGKEKARINLEDISEAAGEIRILAHALQRKHDLTETEIRLVFLTICEDLAKNKVTEFHRESDNGR